MTSLTGFEAVSAGVIALSAILTLAALAGYFARLTRSRSEASGQATSGQSSSIHIEYLATLLATGLLAASAVVKLFAISPLSAAVTAPILAIVALFNWLIVYRSSAGEIGRVTVSIVFVVGTLVVASCVFFSWPLNVPTLVGKIAGQPKPTGKEFIFSHETVRASGLPKSIVAESGQEAGSLDNADSLTLDATTVVLGDAEVGTPLRLAVKELRLLGGSKILTRGGSLEVSAKRIVSEGAAIYSFSNDDPPASPASAGATGQTGRSGGIVVLRTRSLSGLLHVDLRGQNGGMGADGAPGQPGAPGRRGEGASDSFLSCRSGGADGGPGGPGGDGQPGTAGGNGGDGGQLELRGLSEAEVAQISFSSTSGAPGKGGKGGTGGPGGPGGEGGSGSAFCSGGHPGPTGITGHDGLSGEWGKPGRVGRLLRGPFL